MRARYRVAATDRCECSSTFRKTIFRGKAQESVTVGGDGNHRYDGKVRQIPAWRACVQNP